MTRTAARLAELESIRDRELTDDEQREVKRLAHLERQCAARKRKYDSDPGYREHQRAKSRRRLTSKYRTDPEFRNALLASQRARYREARA